MYSEGFQIAGVAFPDPMLPLKLVGYVDGSFAVERPVLREAPRAFVRGFNLKLIAGSEGASLQDCVRLTVYVSDLHRFAPMVDEVQAELWGKPPHPPRTMVEVRRLFDDDIVEIDSVFYAPEKK